MSWRDRDPTILAILAAILLLVVAFAGYVAISAPPLACLGTSQEAKLEATVLNVSANSTDVVDLNDTALARNEVIVEFVDRSLGQRENRKHVSCRNYSAVRNALDEARGKYPAPPGYEGGLYVQYKNRILRIMYVIYT